MSQIVELVGSPGAGKTTLADRLAQLCSGNPAVAVHTHASLGSQYRSYLDHDTSCEIRKALFATLAHHGPHPGHNDWKGRVARELIHGCAHHRMFSERKEALQLSDSRIWGKLLMEAADPRNPEGLSIAGRLLEACYTHCGGNPEQLVILRCRSEVAYDRIVTRVDNKVRSDLSDADRRHFLTNMDQLMEMLPAIVGRHFPMVSVHTVETDRLTTAEVEAQVVARIGLIPKT